MPVSVVDMALPGPSSWNTSDGLTRSLVVVVLFLWLSYFGQQTAAATLNGNVGSDLYSVLEDVGLGSQLAQKSDFRAIQQQIVHGSTRLAQKDPNSQAVQQDTQPARNPNSQSIQQESQLAQNPSPPPPAQDNFQGNYLDQKLGPWVEEQKGRATRLFNGDGDNDEIPVYAVMYAPVIGQTAWQYKINVRLGGGEVYPLLLDCGLPATYV